MLPLLLCRLVACLIPAAAPADGPAPRRLVVVTPKDDAIVAAGINARGDVAGAEWKESTELPGVIGQEPFLARGKRQVFLPLLPTYTSTMPAAVSDDGMVVGRASKPSSPRFRVPLQNQAFTWTEADGIRGLGTLPDDHASFATGVSRDGSRIAGVSIGQDRLRPCVWERQPDAPGGWAAMPLPQQTAFCSATVAISPDGRRVAAVDGSTPTLWTLGPDGTWAREAIGGAGSIAPRAVNDAGLVVGIKSPPDGSTHAVLWTRDRGVEAIPEPAGFARSEANAVNNLGVVVGMVDGPHGSPVGPRAFAFQAGRLRLLDEGGPNLVAATAINDAGQVSGAFEKAEEVPTAPDKPVERPKP